MKALTLHLTILKRYDKIFLYLIGISEEAYLMQSIISISALKKSYKNHDVLKGVSFEVEKGSIFALLGSNGAGKTTTINILSTLAQADGGKATICGYDVATEPDHVRHSISLTGQYATVDERLTARENLILIGRLKNIKKAGEKVDELLKKFNLEEAANRQVATYSGGMRRRLDIAMSLIGDPEVIFLDEPTTGLDPQNRIAMWEFIRLMAAKGATIFLTTQYLEEAEQLANDIAVLHEGEIVAQGTPDELKELLPNGMIQFTFVSLNALNQAESELLGYRIVNKKENVLSLLVLTDGEVDELTDMLVKLKKANIQVSKFEQQTPTLEDVFLTIIGHNKKDGNE